MRFHQQPDSKIILPVEPPKPPEQPSRYRPDLEVQLDWDRKKVAAILGELWDALELGRGPSSIRLPNSAAWHAHYQAFRYIGNMLLGDDCPEKEICT